MAVEKCEHKYWKIVDGKLVCSECGAGPEAQKVEDKETKPQENKQRKGKK